MAYDLKMKNRDQKVVVLVGNGELQEGSNWEAIMFAAHHKLDNLCLIIDKNKMQALGDTKDILCLDPMPEKFSAFGWDVEDIDGNDIEEVISAFECFKHRKGKPFAMVANTIKGKGDKLCILLMK